MHLLFVAGRLAEVRWLIADGCPFTYDETCPSRKLYLPGTHDQMPTFLLHMHGQLSRYWPSLSLMESRETSQTLA